MKNPLLLLLLVLFACQPARQTNVPASAVPQSESFVPTRILTHGPQYHWFGYYDKWQFDPSGRYVLSNEVDFENRSPEAEDVIRVGMIDTEDGDKWIELGESRAWNWQQGCMLQFIPGSTDEVIWNDRQDGKFVSHIVNIHTREKRTLPFPIYTLSPDGKTAMYPDFARLNDMRPGYGYAGIGDQYREEYAPSETGIFKGNLETGETELIISVEDMVQRQLPDFVAAEVKEFMPKGKNYFNHLLFSPDGSRFIFLQRWKPKSDTEKSFGTLMFTSSVDGQDIRLLDPSGYTSHFIWRDTGHILAWTRLESDGEAFYVFEDRENATPEVIGKNVMVRNGHCTYLPDSGWILNDTYPNENRLQEVYLYHVPSGKRIPLGNFFLDRKYTGEWRVDTHPRFSPDGSKVVIDCPVGEEGRQLVMLKIGEVRQK